MTREFKNNLYYRIANITDSSFPQLTLDGTVESEDVVNNDELVYAVIRYEDNETLTAEQIRAVKAERDEYLAKYDEVAILVLGQSFGSVRRLNFTKERITETNPVSKTVMIDDPDSLGLPPEPPSQIPAPLGLRLVIYSTIFKRDLEINRGFIDKNLVPDGNETRDLGSADNRLNRVHTKDIFLSSGMIQQPGGVEIELPMKSGTVALEDDVELQAFIQPTETELTPSGNNEESSAILGGALGDLAYISQVGEIIDEGENTNTIIYTSLGAVLQSIFEEDQAGQLYDKDSRVF